MNHPLDRARALLAAAICLLPGVHASAALRLPALFSDHMMLQAGRPDAVWGWADPGDQVRITLLDPSKSKTLAQTSATAGADGKWLSNLPPLQEGEAGVLEIKSAKGEEKSIADVLVGEVWLCSGQSNMQYTINAPATTPAVGVAVKHNLEVAAREAAQYHPLIRDFRVPQNGQDQPQDDVVGSWLVVDEKSVPKCFAVAWNFAVALHEKLNVPVGFISSAVGSTPVEAWTPKEALESNDEGRLALEKNKEMLAKYTPEAQKQYDEAMAAWQAANPTGALQAQNHASRPQELYSPTYRKVPARLYNGMIHGLEPYTMRGILWFQSDTVLPPENYGDGITAMVESWRKAWGEVLPFYYVEFNNWHEPQTEPVQLTQDGISVIREEQQAVLTLPKTGVATSVDLGDVLNPHFPNKKPVGQRLAGLALADVYHVGDPAAVRSPEFSSYEIQGNKVRLHFKYSNGLRLISGDTVKGFAISGGSNQWVWANGKIDGQDIVVWSDQVPQPREVRYAWADNPILSIENGAGLPLRPFRTNAKDQQRIAHARAHREVVNQFAHFAGTEYLDVPYIDDGDEHHQLDLYVPPGPGPFPLIVTIHGGGWVAGDKETPGIDGAMNFGAAGFAVASPEYRFVTTDPFPAQIEDTKAALQWLRGHAQQYRLDPARVGVFGHSAGAHLAELMATTGDSTLFTHGSAIPTQVQAAVSWAGPADLTRETGNWPKTSAIWSNAPNGLLGGPYDDALAKLASPAYHVHPGLPPFLIVHGAKDNLVPVSQSVAFAAALKKANVDATLDVDPNLDHGIGRDPQKAKDALKFFKRVLMPDAGPPAHE
jgi:sialate O-acetylesterase